MFFLPTLAYFYILSKKAVMLEKEFQYYLDNQSELVEKYIDKFIVIKDRKVIGVYDSEIKAYSESAKNHELG